MQENIQNKDNNSVTPVNTVIQAEQQPKKNNFLTILLSVLLLLSVLIAGFFAFQTQKLVKELTLLRTESTPMANVEPTIKPVATNSAIATADPTANWKTYTNTLAKYQISYPPTYKILYQADGASGDVPSGAYGIFISESSNSRYEDRLIDISHTDLLIDVSPADQWLKTSELISGVKSSKFTKIDKTSNFDIYHIQTKGSGGLTVYVNNKDSKSLDLLNSLKFTN